MNVPIASPRARAMLLICSCGLALFLTFFGLRNAVSAHDQGLDTRQGYERAVRLEPKNARNWYLLGRSYLYDVDDPEPERAEQALRKAVALDPYSAEALLDLAGAYGGAASLPSFGGSGVELRQLSAAAGGNGRGAGATAQIPGAGSKALGGGLLASVQRGFRLEQGAGQNGSGHARRVPAHPPIAFRAGHSGRCRTGVVPAGGVASQSTAARNGAFF